LPFFQAAPCVAERERRGWYLLGVVLPWWKRVAAVGGLCCYKEWPPLLPWHCHISTRGKGWPPLLPWHGCVATKANRSCCHGTTTLLLGAVAIATMARASSRLAARGDRNAAASGHRLWSKGKSGVLPAAASTTSHRVLRRWPPANG
jgi:hypothetical protein